LTVLARLRRWKLGADQYFEIMADTLKALTWPQFDQIMERVDRDLISNFISLPQQEAILVRHCLEARKGINWLMRKYHDRDIMDFIRAPIAAPSVATAGPLVATPSRYLTLHNPNTEPVEVEKLIPDWITAAITEKVWYSGNFTCIVDSFSVFKQSLIGCKTPDHCPARSEPHERPALCKHAYWLRALEHYPGLSRHLMRD
jgi:hypothetical protein